MHSETQSPEDHEINRRLGARIRTLRTMRGMSQSELGDAIGVTFQQVQKYENGKNKISVQRLRCISMALFVSYDDLLRDIWHQPVDAEDLSKPLSLMRAYDRLTPRKQKLVLDLVNSMPEVKHAG